MLSPANQISCHFFKTHLINIQFQYLKFWKMIAFFSYTYFPDWKFTPKLLSRKPVALNLFTSTNPKNPVWLWHFCGREVKICWINFSFQLNCFGLVSLVFLGSVCCFVVPEWEFNPTHISKLIYFKINVTSRDIEVSGILEMKNFHF